VRSVGNSNRYHADQRKPLHLSGCADGLLSEAHRALSFRSPARAAVRFDSGSVALTCIYYAHLAAGQRQSKAKTLDARGDSSFRRDFLPSIFELTVERT
jgi:hypothetical protein